jgi:hypothetical protein
MFLISLVAKLSCFCFAVGPFALASRTWGRFPNNPRPRKPDPIPPPLRLICGSHSIAARMNPGSQAVFDSLLRSSRD